MATDSKFKTSAFGTNQAIQRLPILIIGQGLAGSLLAWEGLKQGYSIRVMEGHKAHAASPVAAGLMNPIIGQRFNKASQIDTCLPIAKKVYQALESDFNTSLLTDRTIIKIFNTFDDKKYILDKIKKNDYSPYLGTLFPAHKWGNDPFGSLEIKGGGTVNIPLLLACIQNDLIKKEKRIDADFDFEALSFKEQKPYYQGTAYEAIIFCEGHHVKHNPFFKNKPFRPSKGDILTLQHPLPKAWMGCVFNNGHWLLPESEVTSRIGATYEWEWDNEPSAKAKNTLLSAFKTLVPDAKMPALLKQYSGIRLATMDTQPLIESHPDYPCLYLFNGFGSKGSLLIPFFAQQFWEKIYQIQS